MELRILMGENINKNISWIRSYVSDVARKLAAKRPFAMPESYQRLLCRLLGISIEENELTMSNYLLLQAKKRGMPIDVTLDLAAVERLDKINTRSKEKVVDLYLQQLEIEITAVGLVDFIATRLHYRFKKIIADNSKKHVDKIEAMKTELGLLGSDDGFSLKEIVCPVWLSLKPANALSITIERRLIQEKCLSPVDKSAIEVLGKHFYYYYSPNNIALMWFYEEEKSVRYRFIDLLQNNLSDLDFLIKSELFFKLANLPNFFSTINDLNFVLDKDPSFVLLIPIEHIVTLLNESGSASLFFEAVKKMPIHYKKEVLKKLSKPVIYQLILNGWHEADVGNKFPELIDFLDSFYLPVEQEEALTLTKQLLTLFLDNGFKDFSNMIFPRIRTIHYLQHLDFSESNFTNSRILQPIENCQFMKANLRNTHFYERVANCWFDDSLLDHVVFHKDLENISFVQSDLRKVNFLAKRNYKCANLVLIQASLSTDSFQSLIEAGVTNFSHADLNEVNFHSIKSIKRLSLDFSHANLQGANLYGLDLRKIKFYGSNLRDSDLREVSVDLACLNNQIKLEGAKLNSYLLADLHQVGIKQFIFCEIFQPIKLTYEEKDIFFKGADFSQSKFVGNFTNINFIHCDLSEVKFFPLSESSQEEFSLITGIHYEKTRLINTTFYQARFNNVTWVECLLEGVVLDNVKMPAKALFILYQQGHRDFNGIKELNGEIPERLPPLALSGAMLSKEAFISLYQQGVSDFRLCHFEFSLGIVLISRGISEVDLKLEGVTDRQSLLSCSDSDAQSRCIIAGVSGGTVSPCAFYFLVLKSGLFVEKQLLLAYINRVIQTDNSQRNKIILKDVAINHKPLFFLTHPEKIRFYWGYQADSDSLVKAIEFMEHSTNALERRSIKVCFYFPKGFCSDDKMKLFARNLRCLGFQQGELNYYTAQGQSAFLFLQNPTIIFYALNLPLSLFPQLDEETIRASNLTINHNEQLFRLYRVAAIMQLSMENGFHFEGSQSVQYEIGFAVMHFLSDWIINTTRPEFKAISSDIRRQLKQSAQQIVEAESENKWASQYVRNLTLRVAVQCIDRSECSNVELVQNAIIDTLNMLWPNTQVNNEIILEKIKKVLEGVGDFFSKRFEAIKKSLLILSSPEKMVLNDRLSACSRALLKAENATSKNTNVSYATNFGELNETKSLPNWYDNPNLVQLIKTIELVFYELGYDLSLEANFSESSLADLLHDLFLALDYCGISGGSDPLLILNLFRDEFFIKSVLNENYLFNNTNNCLKKVAEISETSQARRERSVLSSLQDRKETLYLETINAVPSAAHRPMGWLNTIVKSISNTFFSIVTLPSTRIADESVYPGEETVMTSRIAYQDFSNRGRFNRLTFECLSDQKENDKKNNHLAANQSQELPLATINDGLLLLDFGLKVFHSFFSKKPNKMKKIGKTRVGNPSEEKSRSYCLANSLFFKEILDQTQNSFNQFDTTIKNKKVKIGVMTHA